MPIKKYTAWICDLCGKEERKDDGQGPQEGAWMHFGWRKHKATNDREWIVCPDCKNKLMQSK